MQISSIVYLAARVGENWLSLRLDFWRMLFEKCLISKGHNLFKNFQISMCYISLESLKTTLSESVNNSKCLCRDLCRVLLRPVTFVSRCLNNDMCCYKKKIFTIIARMTRDWTWYFMSLLPLHSSGDFPLHNARIRPFRSVFSSMHANKIWAAQLISLESLK